MHVCIIYDSRKETRATLMSPGMDETRVCGYIRSEFLH